MPAVLALFLGAFAPKAGSLGPNWTGERIGVQRLMVHPGFGFGICTMTMHRLFVIQETCAKAVRFDAFEI
jgi:hypothetical protein